MNKKVFVVGNDHSVKELFTVRGWTHVYSVAAADLVCFTGGADVSPELYDHPKHRTSFCDPHRDQVEMGYFEAATKQGTPMVGICRGGQFLNVMNGGKMYQNVTDHTSTHKLRIVGGDPDKVVYIDVTSTHHQMMMPHPSGKVLGYGTPSMVTYFDDQSGAWVTKHVDEGIEIVRYDDALCFQPHPEFNIRSVDFIQMRNLFFKLIEELMAWSK